MFKWFMRIVKLEERVNNIIRFGVIKEVLSANYVIVDLGEGLETPKLPYLVNSSGNATVYFLPKVADQVIVLSKGGSLHQAFVIPSVYKGTVEGEADEWRLEFNKGMVKYKAGELTITADTEVNIEAKKVTLAGEDGGGVVCKNHLCSFTGAPHPQASSKVFGGL